MNTTLTIAGLSFSVDTEFEYLLIEQFEPFHTPINDENPVHVTFIPVEEAVVGKDLLSGVSYYLDQDLVRDTVHYLGYHFFDMPCHAWMTMNGAEMTVYYLNDPKKYFPSERQIFGPISLEHVFSIFHGFILHSSFIRWKSRGILFSAPSGTGKSTQAELWKNYEHAEILNGDRTAVRYSEGRWNAYGLPYAGSSCIYRNEHCPVLAIVILRQGKTNELKQLGKMQAFQLLLSELTLHPWDAGYMDRVMTDLNLLVDQIPVYQLICRPNREAVKLLKNEMEEILNAD